MVQHDKATDALARQGALAQEDHPMRLMGARTIQEAQKKFQANGLSRIVESDEPPELLQPPLQAPAVPAPGPSPDQLPDPDAVAEVYRFGGLRIFRV